MNDNIVITGLGIISAIGVGKDAVLQSLREKRTGIGTMRHLVSSHHELPVGEVNRSNDELKADLGIDTTTEVSRTALLGMIAVEQAIVESGIEQFKQLNPNKRIVLVSGTTVGGMDLTENYFDSFNQNDDHIATLLQHDCGSCTQLMANHFNVIDECSTISTACSSAANALILGYNLLKSNQADIVITGGTEALSRFHLNGFNSLQILDHQNCRPFDETRAGLNLGEGAAYVVLERESDAHNRKAGIYAYLSGYGNACDAFHQTASSENGEGAYRAMKQAMEMSGLKPEDIQYVNAHGTATPNNDQTESAAIKRVFGDCLPPISSTKSFTGHTTSASGSIETVICLLAMRYGFVPANLGWSTPMSNGIIPSGRINDYPIDNVLCNSFGFGGNDTSLVLSKNPHVGAEVVFNTSKEIRVASQVELTDESQLAEIKNYVKPLEARRMGKIMKSSLLSSLKALEQAGIERPDAIITATAWGCLEYSERLLEQLRDEGEVLLKPTYFMQSTHNTIGSNIAIRLNCHGYNVTYTHGDQSLDWALRDAHLLLQSGRCHSVLVGLHDEMTPLLRSLLERQGVNVMSSNIYSKAIVLTCGK